MSSDPTIPSPDLTVTIADIRLPNPLVLASGILGTHASLMERVARAGAGAITAKSAGPVPRGGHVNPTCVDFGPGLLNAIGLANPGAAAEVALLAETRAALAPLGVPLIASIFADTVDNFARVAEIVARAEPDLLEVNISCPNVGSEFGEPFAGSCESAAAVTAAVRAAAGLPLVIKLAPNVPDIGRIAQAVVAAGADAICAINTMPGMLIDIESGLPVLHNRTGGVSGPALRPIAVNAVYQIARAVDVPIIGTGGVASGADALELITAGATAVGVGSAVYAEGVDVFARILGEIAAWLSEHQLSLADVRGRAHRQIEGPEPPTPAPVPHAGSHSLSTPQSFESHHNSPSPSLFGGGGRGEGAGQPINAWSLPATGLPRPLRVRAVIAENYRTRTIVLDASIAADPGQFAMLWLPGQGEKPFSLRAADPLAFTIAAVGPFSRAVHGLAVGDRIWFRGPFGQGFALEGRDHLMVGGGYGVAPLLYLAQQALARGDRVRAVIGARTAADLLLADAFVAAGAEVYLATEDGSGGTGVSGTQGVGVQTGGSQTGEVQGGGMQTGGSQTGGTRGGQARVPVTHGRVTDVVGPLIAADRPSTLYACGPHGMLDALVAQSAAARLPAQLAWEAYMRCGIGICGSCEHGGRLVCADGPVERLG